jgi:hypothetical protein
MGRQKKQNNRFKKQHFLNRLNKITDLKSESKGVNKKNLHGIISKKKLLGDNAKIT